MVVGGSVGGFRSSKNRDIIGIKMGFQKGKGEESFRWMGIPRSGVS